MTDEQNAAPQAVTPHQLDKEEPAGAAPEGPSGSGTPRVERLHRKLHPESALSSKDHYYGLGQDPIWELARQLERELAKAEAELAARAAPVRLPKGWATKQLGDGTLIVSHNRHGGYAAKDSGDNIAAVILYKLASDLIATPAPATEDARDAEEVARKL